MRNRSIDRIAREKQAFTIDDARRTFGIKDASVKVVLSRLEKSGWIERIEKGKYMVVPLGASKGNYTLNEFVLANILAPGGAVAYWSALNFHGMTEQIPNTIFVQTPRRKKRGRMELFGLKYRFIVLNEKRFFGTEDVWIGEDLVTITGPEKTIIDCLDKPHLCGGIVEAAKGIKGGKFDPNELKELSLRFGSSAVIRRLGYLSDMFDVRIDLPRTYQRSYASLDPTLGRQGNNDPKWRLKVNVDLRDLE